MEKRSFLLEKEIRQIFFDKREEISKRLKGFKEIWERGNEEDIFAELVFCLLTPGSRARSAWSCVERLRAKDLLLHGNHTQIAHELNIVRYRNNKTLYILQARERFSKNGKIFIKAKILNSGNIQEKREWLVSCIKGIGYKEASHFLRNIGFSENLAILDRHVLKNLLLLGVIEEVPKSLTRIRYITIEKLMMGLSQRIEIPLNHLDFVLWFKETGEIFK